MFQSQNLQQYLPGRMYQLGQNGQPSGSTGEQAGTAGNAGKYVRALLK